MTPSPRREVEGPTVATSVLEEVRVGDAAGCHARCQGPPIQVHLWFGSSWSTSAAGKRTGRVWNNTGGALGAGAGPSGKVEVLVRVKQVHRGGLLGLPGWIDRNRCAIGVLR